MLLQLLWSGANLSAPELECLWVSRVMLMPLLFSLRVLSILSSHFPADKTTSNIPYLTQCVKRTASSACDACSLHHALLRQLTPSEEHISGHFDDHRHLKKRYQWSEHLVMR